LAKVEALKFTGVVVEILPNATFRVKIDGTETVILGVISGRMRQHNIKVTVCDAVEIECSPYDLTRGRIVRRN
jgi:translation initiation factor IF-1